MEIITAAIMASKQTVKVTVKRTGLAAVKKRKTRSDKGKKHKKSS